MALAAADRFGMMLAGGIATWFSVQAIINIGGVSGVMPVTGLTLPFISFGGSSLMASMAAAGLLLNIARHARCRALGWRATSPPVRCRAAAVGGMAGWS